MSKLAIKAENVGKMYRLGQVGTGTVSQDLNRWYARVRGKEDPFTKIGETNDRTQKGDSNIVWALKDVNFEIQQGDAVGIIGRNGAGKSTLLKILSKVTKPTTGNIKLKGRIASLLEVGTGFHPEMTGRENIYLNGAILGMTKKEITRKFDEIVDFSGVERYIDTPVKRYSSGMYVRLAFAVAAHLESEILIVDEVLAVGDSEFQKKCLGKMGDVSKGEGRTVLFVSHNMPSVKQLCSAGILMQNGAIAQCGEIDDIVSVYNAQSLNTATKMSWDTTDAPGNERGRILSVQVYSGSDDFLIEAESYVEVVYENLYHGQNMNVSLSVFADDETYVLSTPNLNRYPHEKGIYRSRCTLPKNFFNTKDYYFTILLVGDNYELVAQLDKVIKAQYIENGDFRGEYFGKWNGLVRPHLNWEDVKV